MKEQLPINKYNKKGFSLVALTIAVALIGIIVSSAVYGLVQASVLIITAKQRDTATSLMQEQFNSVISNGRNNWGFISANTGTLGSLVESLSFTSSQIINGTTTTNNSTIVVGAGSSFTNDLTVGDSIAFFTPTTISGTTTSNATTKITGTSTTFTSQLAIGDIIALSGSPSIFATVLSIPSDTSVNLNAQLGNGASQTIIKSNPTSQSTVSTINSDTSLTINPAIGIGGTQNILRYKNSYLTSTGAKNTFQSATIFSSSYTIDKSYRTAGGNLSNSTSDTLDMHYRLLTATTSWTNITGNALSVSTQSYISDYDSKKLVLSSFNDFRLGSAFNSTYINPSGQVSLSNLTGTAYSLTGTYTSQVFDTFSTGNNFYIADITIDLPTLGSTTINPTGANAVVFKAQGANTVSAINTSPSFQNVTCITVPGYIQSAPTYNYQCDLSSVQQKRYFQYQLTLNTLSGTNTQTPLVRTMIFYYQ